MEQLFPSIVEEGSANVALRKQVDGRILGLRINRYSWWVHWRELADFLLPRRYKWLIIPNQSARGSPINQHIIDSTATIAARNLASGMMSMMSNPAHPWFKLRLGFVDSTQTSPVSLWLAEVERRMMLVFQKSNFYPAMATMFFDLVVFGTAAMLMYEDDEHIINMFNPCLGEFYVDINSRFEVDIFYREFVLTVQQVIDEFGWENASPAVRGLYKTGQAQLTREVLMGHAIEPNQDGRRLGIQDHFKYREVFWEVGQPRE